MSRDKLYEALSIGLLVEAEKMSGFDRASIIGGSAIAGGAANKAMGGSFLGGALAGAGVAGIGMLAAGNHGKMMYHDTMARFHDWRRSANKTGQQDHNDKWKAHRDKYAELAKESGLTATVAPASAAVPATPVVAPVVAPVTPAPNPAAPVAPPVATPAAATPQVSFKSKSKPKTVKASPKSKTSTPPTAAIQNQPGVNVHTAPAHKNSPQNILKGLAPKTGPDPNGP